MLLLACDVISFIQKKKKLLQNSSEKLNMSDTDNDQTVTGLLDPHSVETAKITSFRRALNIDEITTDQEEMRARGLRFAWPDTDDEWVMFVFIETSFAHPVVSACITPVVTPTRDYQITYGIRMIGSSATVELTEDDVVANKNDQVYDKDVSVEEELQQLAKNNKITIVLSVLTSRSAHFDRPVVNIDEFKFTDFTVMFNDSPLIKCHKEVLASESKVIMRALSLENTKESKNSCIDIGKHSNATQVNIHQLVDCMYNGWTAAMDENAGDLYVIAECYECPRVEAMACESLRRHLTNDTFWKTCQIASMHKQQDQTLLNACAEFAKTSVWELLKRGDAKALTNDTNDGTVQALMMAITSVISQA